jgi:organic hydroperoxide reductase OsmC/OhrA
MQDLPHRYHVSADAKAADSIMLSSAGLPNLESAAPSEFGGPGDQWSPETLLVASIADCFVLSFRAIARASRFEWESLACEVDGTLDRIDRITQFTQFDVAAKLIIQPGGDETKAMRLLEKAEQACLITNSLKASSHLKASVIVGSS